VRIRKARRVRDNAVTAVLNGHSTRVVWYVSYRYAILRTLQYVPRYGSRDNNRPNQCKGHLKLHGRNDESIHFGKELGVDV
jgi:hypothetical protein